jgi:hypothetical protein
MLAAAISHLKFQTRERMSFKTSSPFDAVGDGALVRPPQNVGHCAIHYLFTSPIQKATPASPGYTAKR